MEFEVWFRSPHTGKWSIWDYERTIEDARETAAILAKQGWAWKIYQHSGPQNLVDSSLRRRTNP